MFSPSLTGLWLTIAITYETNYGGLHDCLQEKCFFDFADLGWCVVRCRVEMFIVRIKRLG